MIYEKNKVTLYFKTNIGTYFSTIRGLGLK